jgi:bacteriophage N4 adsorption protein B
MPDEAAAGLQFKAVVLHDAEDVVHRDELQVLGTMIDRYDLVQLPVVAMIHPKSRWGISGSYVDEFAESHGKEMVVRGAIGAALPSAGVGCAFSRAALVKIAGTGGLPFDAASLTEDYELGLKLRDLGATAAFVRVRDAEGRLVATREYFPHRFGEAVHQKSRWMTGIALAGWDRLGWSGRLAERWMRLRDRQSLLAAFLLLCGYVSFGLWLLLQAAGLAAEWRPVEVGPMLVLALRLNLALLAWRVVMRFGFVTHLYGWRQGLLSIPRILTGNVIAIAAAAKALLRYRTIVRGGKAEWGKTAHDFPVSVEA